MTTSGTSSNRTISQAAEESVIINIEEDSVQTKVETPDSGHSHHGHSHSHTHSPEAKKKQLNRLARAIGHLKSIQGMIERDEDCADVLVQLSAVRSAINNLGKVIIDEHMTHCIYHAIEEGDETSVREFQDAIRKFL
ncbi:MAG: metal-sensing transcriptional repressor [Anaerovoracaceae bacterium]